MSSHTWLPKRRRGYEWDMSRRNNQILTDLVCRAFGITPAMLCIRDKHFDIVNARMTYAYVLRYTTTSTLFRIAADLGYGDHSTVIHLLNRAERFLFTKEESAAKMLQVQAEFTRAQASIQHPATPIQS